MAVSRDPRRLRGTGKLTRLGLFVQVGAAVLLAFGAASLLGWLAAQPGLRQRVDLTQGGQNTLDEAMRRVIDQLPGDEPVRFDVFFRPLEPPLRELSIEVIERTYRILMLMREQWPGKIEVTNHDLTDLAGGDDAQARMVALDVTELPVLVASQGKRKVILRVMGDLAELDIGNPAGGRGAYVPPRIVRYRAEEAITRAILRVSRGASSLALFATGHGEPDLYDSEPGGMGLGRLQSALVEDGFRVRWWEPGEEGAVPADAAVLALIGPIERFSERELDWVRDFLDRGGRVLAAPPQPTPPGRGNLPELLADYGVQVGGGLVSHPVPGVGGRWTDGEPECAALTVPTARIHPTHPITEPLRRAGRRVRSVYTSRLERHRPDPGSAEAQERSVPPRGAVIEDLLASGELSWADSWRAQGPDGASGGYDLVYQEQGPGAEPTGPFSLAMAVAFSPLRGGPGAGGEGHGDEGPVDEGPERPESRLVVLGAPAMLSNVLFDTNRDFLLNTFNWLAGREFRVSISTRDPEARRLELGEAGRVAWIQGVAVVGIPLLCLALGLLTWRVRRR